MTTMFIRVSDTSNATRPRTEASAHKSYPDAMRTLGAAAVIVVHVAAFSVSYPEEVPSTWWWAANVYDAACRWCVPIFIMLSGALLLDPARQEDAWTFYRRRLMRVGVPLVFWTAFYLCWRKFYSGQSLNLADSVRAVAMGTPYVHLYFLYLMAGLYLFTPILRDLLRTGSQRNAMAATLLALACGSGSSMIGVILGLKQQTTAIALFVPYIGYYLLGYVLSTQPMAVGWQKRTWLVAAGAAAVVAGGAGFLKTTGRFGGLYLFYGYLSPVVVILSASVFVLIKGHFEAAVGESSLTSRFLRWVAPATLGIYLVHAAILDLVLSAGGSFRAPHPLLAVPAWSAAVFAISLGIVKGIEQIPYVRRIVV